MADNNTENLIKAIEKLNDTVRNFYENQPNRTGSPSDIDDYQLSNISRSKNLDENQKKFLQKQYENYERSNRGFWAAFRNQRTWGGFFRSYVERSQERLAKRAIARKLPSATREEVNSIYKSMPYAFKGRGALSGIFTTLTKFAKGLSVVTFGLQILADILKATAEARKFYVPSIRQGYGFNQLSSMFDNSTRTLNLLRNPLVSGMYANNPAYKDAFAEIMSAGVLNQNGIRDTEALVKSFKFVASQGLILGETFSDTAKNIVSAASIYNLGFNGNIMDGYKYINKFVERGIAEGFSKSGFFNLFLNYSKSAAVTNNGLVTVMKDMKVMFDTVTAVNPDKNQMPYFANIFQNLMSSRLSSLSTFAALVDGGSSYSVAGLGRLAQLYQGSSPLAQKTIALRTLLRKSGMGTSKGEIALMTELYPEFSAFRDEKSVSVLKNLVDNAGVTKRFLQETQGLSSKEMAEWVIKNAGISEKEKVAVERMAQATEAMSNPLQTIINITTGMLNILYSIAGSPVLKLFSSDIRVGPAEQYIDKTETRTGRTLNQFNEYRQRS